MSSTPWIEVARKYIGTREAKGAAHNPVIVRWLTQLGAWWRDDETPWCGTFVAAVMRESSITPPHAWYRAKAWLDWGVPFAAPAVGMVVVFERVGGGHVGIVVGKTPAGFLLVLGGNQGDEVNIRAFDPARVIGYRWPQGQRIPVMGQLPVLANARLSESEA